MFEGCLSENQTLQFLLGSEAAAYSQIWEVKKNKSDIYMFGAMFDGKAKLSLHQPDICQYALLNTDSETQRLGSKKYNTYTRWRRAQLGNNEVIPVAKLFFASDFLIDLERIPTKTRGKVRCAIDRPPSGYCAMVALAFCAPEYQIEKNALPFHGQCIGGFLLSPVEALKVLVINCFRTPNEVKDLLNQAMCMSIDETTRPRLDFLANNIHGIAHNDPSDYGELALVPFSVPLIHAPNSPRHSNGPIE